GTNGMSAFPNMSETDLKSLTDYLLLRDRPTPPGNIKSERPRYSFTGYPRFLDNEGYPANKPPWGTLNCIDLNTGKLLWKVPLGEYPALSAQGVPKTGTENYGGAIVTAGGLLFAPARAMRKSTRSTKKPAQSCGPANCHGWAALPQRPIQSMAGNLW